MPESPTDALVGRQAGTYKLLRRIGEGGMGVVYLAERTEDFAQLAAVKLLLDHLDPEIVRRFRVEKQAMAALNHPNIVGLFDAGVMDGNVPYLAMEYVEGIPLDRYVASQGTPLEGRIRLIVSILDALEYAHQHLLAHCDLKFSNVLVTEAGQVRLLDFGIAKLLNPAQYGFSDALTRHYRPFTPEFASPEQLQGSPLTIATDIYTSGVLLFTLLTGEHPFEDVVTQPVALVDAICARDAPAASERAAQAKNAPMDPKRLRGDLDAIAAKALRKDPQARYGSAAAFRDDLLRYLNGEAVAAHRGSLRYRLKKFARRSPAIAAAACILTFALLAGVAGTVAGMVRADRDRSKAESRFRDLRQLSNSLLATYFNQLSRVPGSTKVQQMLVTRSLAYLESIASKGGTPPDLAVDLAEGYVKLASIQGNPYDNNLGQPNEALASLDRAIQLATPVARDVHRDHAAFAALAKARSGKGDVLISMGRASEAVAESKIAADLADRLVVDRSNDLDTLYLGAEVHESLGDKLGNAGLSSMMDSAGAVSHFRRSQELFGAAAKVAPKLLRPRRAAIGLGLKLADQVALTDQEAALMLYRKTLDAFKNDLTVEEQNNLVTRRLRNFALRHLGETLTELRRFSEAEPYFSESIRISDSLLKIDPTNHRTKWDLAVAYHSLGLTQHGEGKAVEALASFEAVRRLLESMDTMSESLEVQNSLGESYTLIAGEKASLGDKAGAELAAKKGLGILRKLASGNDVSPRTLAGVSESFMTVKPESLQDPQFAAQLLERCTEGGTKGDSKARAMLADAWWRAGQRDRGKALAIALIAEFRAAGNNSSSYGWAKARAEEVAARH